MAFNLFGKKEKKEKKPAKQADVAAPAEVTAPKKDEPKPESAPVMMQSGTNVLKHMHVSEKSSMGQAGGKYTFLVEPTATKNEIAKAVASRYNVQVTSVNIVRLRGKRRRIGRYTGSTKRRKKAIVTIGEGQQIASSA